MSVGGETNGSVADSAVAAADQEMEISLHTLPDGQNPSALRYPPPPQPPQPPEPPRPVVELVDPIEEDPSAIWYVRPPSGGQFGPADGEVMHLWIGEGRISVNSLVWREGWEQWEEAIQVFPQLSPAVNNARAKAEANAVQPAEIALSPKTTSAKFQQSIIHQDGIEAPPSTQRGGWRIWVGLSLAVAATIIAGVSAICLF